MTSSRFRTKGVGALVGLALLGAVSLSTGAPPDVQALAPAPGLCPTANAAFCGRALHMDWTGWSFASKAVGAHYGPGWSQPASANNSTGTGFCLGDEFTGVPTAPVVDRGLPSGWTTPQLAKAAWLMATYGGDKVSPYQGLAIDANGELVGWPQNNTGSQTGTQQRLMAVHFALMATVQNTYDSDPGPGVTTAYYPLVDLASLTTFSDIAGTIPNAFGNSAVTLAQQMMAQANAHFADQAGVVFNVSWTSGTAPTAAGTASVTVTVTKGGHVIPDYPVWTTSPDVIGYTGTTSTPAYLNAQAASFPSMDYSATHTVAGVTNAAGKATFDVNVTALGGSWTFNGQDTPASIHRYGDGVSAQDNISWSAPEIRPVSGVIAADLSQPVAEAIPHLRKSVSVDGGTTWHNAETGAAGTYTPAGTGNQQFDNGAATAGDDYPVVKAGTVASYRYEVWLDASSTGSILWSDIASMVSDDNGTPANTADDFKPVYVSGDTNSDGYLDLGEIWVFSDGGHTRTIAAGDDITNISTLVPGDVVDTPTHTPVDVKTPVRTDPARVTAPSVSTTASNSADGTQVATPGASLNDAVDYCNMIVGVPVTFTVQWMTQAGAPVAGLTATATVTPTASCGTANVGPVTVPYGAPALLVAFETITSSTGVEVASHKDLTSVPQTMTINGPTLSTTAKNVADGSHIAFPGAVLMDTVDYCKLAVGVPVTFSLQWMTQAGVPVAGMTATKTVTPTASCGSVDVGPATVPAGVSGALVAFETLKDASSVELASHKDLTSAAQTVTVYVPTITTFTNPTRERNKDLTNNDTAVVGGMPAGVSFTIHLDVYRLVPGGSVTPQSVCTAQAPVFSTNYTGAGNGNFVSPSYPIPAGEVAGVLYVHQETLIVGGKAVAKEPCGSTKEITTIVRKIVKGRTITTS